MKTIYKLIGSAIVLAVAVDCALAPIVNPVSAIADPISL